MKFNKIASVIGRSVWLIDPRIAQGYMGPIARLMNGEKVSFFDEYDDEDPNLSCFVLSAKMEMSAIAKGKAGNVFSDAPQGSLAIIPITGTVMKDDNCGAPGSDTMAGWMRDAYTSENIAAVILKVNSGGGSVAGTGEFGDVIASANKPVLAYCDALMASAAYWLGSCAHEIWASHKTVEIGSIGTAISFMDNQKALASYGYTKHYINADSSPDKNQDFFSALAGDYEQIKTNILNPTNDIFLQTVKENRPNLKLTDVKINKTTYQEPLTGKVYLAQAAIDNGLIDQIGSFEDAANRAFDLAANDHKLQPLKKDKNMFNKFKSLSSLKGKKATEITESDVQAVNNQIEAEGIEGVTLVADSQLEELTNVQTSTTDATALATANTTITDLRNQVTAANTAKSAAETALATANAAKATAEAALVTANAKIAELGGQAAATHTTSQQEQTDTIPGAGAKSATYTESDAKLAEFKAKNGFKKNTGANGKANFLPALDK